MGRKAFYFAFLFFLLLVDFQKIHAADSRACTKPKVAVELKDFYERTYEVLQRQYPFQTKEYWLSHIQQKMLEKLKANSPGIEIFPMASGKEYDYYIKYNVSVIGCGEQEKIGNLLSSKDTCYWVHGTLYSKDACGLAGVGFRSASIRYKDIDTAVTLFALQMGNIETIAAAHERERPIPPRGPQIRIDKEPKPVSPLEGERETIVDARVANCRGEPVYDKAGKRYGVVAGPKQGQRGETHPFQENASAEVSNWWSVSPNAQGGASLKYKLTKGVKAGTETITFVACGLGTKAEKKQAVEIDGLEIRVKPQKTQIKSGESTRIDIEFAKVSVKGERKPVPGKELRLKIEGLKDGVVSPKDKISTNAEGRASLVYQAGQNDKTVKITAFYQPQGFPDRAEGSAAIQVQEVAHRLHSYAILRGSRIEKTTSNCTESSPGYSKKGKSKEELSIDASVLITFDDDYSVNYNEHTDEYRWVLKVRDITLSDFSYRHVSETSSQDYDSQNPPLVMDVQHFLSGWATDPMIVAKENRTVQIYFDGKTRKAKRAHMKAEIGFVRHLKTRMTGRERKSGPMGPPYHYVDFTPFEQVREANHRFTISPLEEKNKEVTFGDGISFFGGQGKKNHSKSFKGGCGQSVEEQTFHWEIHLKPGNR